jgi:hypothetical protein
MRITEIFELGGFGRGHGDNCGHRDHRDHGGHRNHRNYGDHASYRRDRGYRSGGYRDGRGGY